MFVDIDENDESKGTTLAFVEFEQAKTIDDFSK